ncbi:hypothetical protein NECID01_1067 [Nematocida sp. AWRm77]|nr:hypothetical protein NECID01_1067 [Nematocida sp. AWRm77]
MKADTQHCSPTYDQLSNRTRSLYAATHMFRGTKLDLTKEISRKSFFTLSNTESGLSLNYVLNTAKRLFTVSVYSNGSVLGKLAPTSEQGGLSLTCMKSSGTSYIDLDLSRSWSQGSFSLKAINPEFSANPNWKFSSILTSISEINKESLAQQGSRIKKTMELSAKELKDVFVNRVQEHGKGFKGGVFSISGVLQPLPSVHFGMEHLLSVDNIQNALKKTVVSTYLGSKAFSSWRIMGVFQSTGKVGVSVEKEVDDSLTVYSDFFIDTHKLQRNTKAVFNSITGIMGASISGHSSTTKVGVCTNGTVEAVSDIAIGDGASLNLSTQLSSGGSQIGLGFTIVS